MGHSNLPPGESPVPSKGRLAVRGRLLRYIIDIRTDPLSLSKGTEVSVPCLQCFCSCFKRYNPSEKKGRIKYYTKYL